MNVVPARRESVAPMPADESAAVRRCWTPGASGSWAIALTLLGLGLSIFMAVLSDGVHQDDDLMHLQMARWAWDYPAYLLNDWGRPGFTVLYAAPARLGWLAARVFSGVLTALTAWLAYLIARRQGVRLAALVPALFWLQPLTFTLSYTTLTETPLALYVALALWLYVRGNYGWSAATISLAAVTRHEAALFLGVWLAALLWRRRPLREWVWLVWAPLAHNVLSLLFLHRLPARLFFDPHPTAAYGAGTWFTMLAQWPVAAGVGVLLLAWMGAPDLWRRRGGTLCIVVALAYFIAHTVIYRFGLFGSAAYARFLVPLGPLVAIAAAAALSHAAEQWARPAATDSEPLLSKSMVIALAGILLLWMAVESEIARLWPLLIQLRLEWVTLPLRTLGGVLSGICLAGWLVQRAGPRMGRIAMTAVSVCLLALMAAQPFVVSHIPPPFEQCTPLVLSDRERAYQAAANWLRSGGLEKRCCYAPAPWLDEFFGRRHPPRAASPTVDEIQPGEVWLWDAHEAGAARYGVTLAALRLRPDFIERWHSGGGPVHDVYCAAFEKRPAPKDTTEDDVK